MDETRVRMRRAQRQSETPRNRLGDAFKFRDRLVARRRNEVRTREHERDDTPEDAVEQEPGRVYVVAEERMRETEVSK